MSPLAMISPSSCLAYNTYIPPSLYERRYKTLEEVIPLKQADETTDFVAANANKGCLGMDQWSILILGTLRLELNADYDCIQGLANQHRTLRMMLGHGDLLPIKTSL